MAIRPQSSSRAHWAIIGPTGPRVVSAARAGHAFGARDTLCHGPKVVGSRSVRTRDLAFSRQVQVRRKGTRVGEDDRVGEHEPTVEQPGERDRVREHRLSERRGIKRDQHPLAGQLHRAGWTSSCSWDDEHRGGVAAERVVQGVAPQLGTGRAVR